MPVWVRRPSALSRGAIKWSGRCCARTRSRSTMRPSFEQCHPCGGQATEWLVVAPPLKRTTSVAVLGVVDSTVTVTSWICRRKRRLRSMAVVVGASQTAGRSSARVLTACCSSAVRGANSVRRAFACLCSGLCIVSKASFRRFSDSSATSGFSGSTASYRSWTSRTA